MKEAFEEYMEILNLSNKWVIKHWKGYLMFCAIYTGIWMTIIYFDNFKSYIESKVKKFKKVEES